MEVEGWVQAIKRVESRQVELNKEPEVVSETEVTVYYSTGDRTDWTLLRLPADETGDIHAGDRVRITIEPSSRR
jgi:hypothetical protein